MNRREREQTRQDNAERNRTLRINALDKALFLIAQNVIPLKVEVSHGEHNGQPVTRQTFWFDYDSSEPYAALWQQLKDTVIDAGRDGRSLTTGELTELSKGAWDELETKYGRVAQ